MSPAAKGDRGRAPARTRPMIAFIVVDLPAPLRPTRRDALAGADLERDVVQDLRPAVPGVERRLKHGAASAAPKVVPPPKIDLAAPRASSRTCGRPALGDQLARASTMMRSAWANTTSMLCSVKSTPIELLARELARSAPSARCARAAPCRRSARPSAAARLVGERDRELDPLDVAVGEHAERARSAWSRHADALEQGVASSR